MKAEDIKPLILPVGLVVGAFIFGKKLLEFLQLSDTKEEKEQKESATKLEKADYWNPSWGSNTEGGKYKTAYLLSAASGKTLSDKLYNASHWYNDDEDEIFGVFNALNYQTQVSSLAYWFNKYYGKDLYSFIKSIFNAEELTQLKIIIDKKPLGKVK